MAKASDAAEAIAEAAAGGKFDEMTPEAKKLVIKAAVQIGYEQYQKYMNG